MHLVYIIHSKKLGKFYTGYTSKTVEERLAYHIYNNQGFTGRADDWTVVFTKKFVSKRTALAFEKKIKKRGASRFLNDL